MVKGDRRGVRADYSQYMYIDHGDTSFSLVESRTSVNNVSSNKHTVNNVVTSLQTVNNSTSVGQSVHTFASEEQINVVCLNYSKTTGCASENVVQRIDFNKYHHPCLRSKVSNISENNTAAAGDKLSSAGTSMQQEHCGLPNCKDNLSSLSMTRMSVHKSHTLSDGEAMQSDSHNAETREEKKHLNLVIGQPTMGLTHANLQAPECKDRGLLSPSGQRSEHPLSSIGIYQVNTESFQERQELHQEHHLKRRSAASGAFASGHVHTVQTTEKTKRKIIQRLGPFIGLVSYKGQPCGTCLAIGDPDEPCVVTCYHVIKRAVIEANMRELRVIFEKEYRIDEGPEKLLACFNYDYAILKLRINEGLKMPPTWTSFKPVPNTDFPLYLVAYQLYDLSIDDSVVVLNKSPLARILQANSFERGGYTELLHSGKRTMKHGRLLVQSSFINGASGGIGIYIDNAGEMHAVFMYQRGFPSQYYWKLDPPSKRRFPSEHLVEQALPFEDLNQVILEVENMKSAQSSNTPMHAKILFNGFNSVGAQT